MNELNFSDRISFHERIEVMEVDFSNLRFTTADQVDAFYDEVDRRLAATDRRWYFLVNYFGCDIESEAWDRFTERGKQANINYSLGTVRVGATARTRETILEDSRHQKFRSNIYEDRDAALLALGEKRKRREVIGLQPSEAYLRIDDVHLEFGGVQALQGVGFSVQRGEIFSIIGPNGAGKTSIFRVFRRSSAAKCE